FPAMPAPESSSRSLHDALPIFDVSAKHKEHSCRAQDINRRRSFRHPDLKRKLAHPLTATASTNNVLNVQQLIARATRDAHRCLRSEEHTSELQSLRHLVCRLLL